MAKDLLLRFTPHIPRRKYATGWTADRQVAFIAALARTGVVSHAARSVGMSPRSAHPRATASQRPHGHYKHWKNSRRARALSGTAKSVLGVTLVSPSAPVGVASPRR
ncbi:hypothetical protein [Sphingomonas soli]|uniref:hypothetical protein n=1 Tax=Sphingomonas soli TaxID=266127 RepID=UPI000B2C9403|nr:hypothetical protein [Sphingomonas soli]